MRPVGSSSDSRGVACLILLLLVGGILAVYRIVQHDQSEAATASATAVIAPLLTGRPAARPQVGSIPSADAPPVPATAAAAAALPAEPTAQPTVTPAPTRAPDRFRVAETDGLGVALHASPNNAARLPQGLAEGAQVTVLERVGTGWARVKADDGQEGWVGAAYLAPAD